MDAIPRNWMSYHPLRKPGWRWLRAQVIVQQRLRLSQRFEDEPTIELARFLRASSQIDKSKACNKHPRRWGAVACALEVFRANNRQRWEVEARILGGQDDASVAKRVHLDAEAVQWYEVAFFDVRAYLRAKDWIATQVLGIGEP